MGKTEDCIDPEFILLAGTGETENEWAQRAARLARMVIFLQQERDRFAEALRPFARYAEEITGRFHAPNEVRLGLLFDLHSRHRDANPTLGDCRRASKLLGTLPQGKGVAG